MKNNYCYIHIPFCSSKCKYCRFASFWWDKQLLKINLYMDKLISDIINTNFSLKNKKIKSIYFWWWTPSVLSEDNLQKILDTLKQKYTFDKDIEITLESTPITVTKQNLYTWTKLWINRLSIWVQTLNNDSLIEIGRWEKWDILMSLDNIKELFSDKLNLNVSVDFIIWLPYVKKWEVVKDIEYLLDNYDFINHMSVYMLEEYYNSWKLENDSKFQNITYPKDWKNHWIDESDYLDEYLEINNFLRKKWFTRYEISNFARNKKECKHNKSYWDHSNIIAYWLWAHWFINSVRYNYHEDFSLYYKWWYDYIEFLDKDDIFIEKIMFWLRTKWIDIELLNELNTEKISLFIKDWLLNISKDTLKITDKWILLLDYILSEIII